MLGRLMLNLSLLGNRKAQASQAKGTLSRVPTAEV